MRIALQCVDRDKEILKKAIVNASLPNDPPQIEYIDSLSRIFHYYSKGNTYHVLILTLSIELQENILELQRLRKKNPFLLIYVIGDDLKHISYVFLLNTFQLFTHPLDILFLENEFKRGFQSYRSHYIYLFLEKNKKWVQIRKIYYIDVIERKTTVHTIDKVYKSNETLAHIRNLLQPYPFVQINKSTLVHMRYVESIHKNDLYLVNKEQLWISRFYEKKASKEIYLYFDHLSMKMNHLVN